MARQLDHIPPCEALAEIARDFHGRGWMAGTAGNLSTRASDNKECFWITSSGLPKGCLEANDFILIRSKDGNVEQQLKKEAKPSAETSIHQAIYNLYPDAMACFHVHSIDACIATDLAGSHNLELRLPPLEMIKGLGIWEQDPEVYLPLFDNTLDVPTIAREITHRFRRTPPQVPALMIRGHGTTVWGNSLQQAYNHIEIVEFLMSFLARKL